MTEDELRRTVWQQCRQLAHAPVTATSEQLDAMARAGVEAIMAAVQAFNRGVGGEPVEASDVSPL